MGKQNSVGSTNQTKNGHVADGDERMRSSSGARWAAGAAMLGAAAVISKLLGTLQKIPLQNVAGDGAYGIYTVVYPFYTLILFLATAGFPVAVSVFVSGRLASGDQSGAHRVLKVATVLLAFTGCAGFLLLYVGSGMIAGWIGNVETEPAIRSVSFALLFVPVMAALRGFFQGSGNMLPTAVSQVVEQFVRVGTMIVVLIAMTAHHIEDRWVAAGATFGAVTGACAGMAMMLHYWARHRRGESRLAGDLPSSATRGSEAKSESYPRLAAAMLRFAIPVCLGAIAVPVLGIVDTFTLPRLFRTPNMNETEAMVLFGVYSRGLPLVQMTAMLVSSIAVALVPAIAEARAHGDHALARARAELSMRVTWIVGAAASVGLATLALPINVMLYKNNEGTAAMAILAFTAVCSMLNIITASIMQGYRSPLLPAIHLLIAAAVKTGLNFLLAPSMGINGAALAGVIAFAIASLLNIMVVIRQAGLTARISVYLWKTGAALACMTVVIFIWRYVLEYALSLAIAPGRLSATVITLPAIALGAITYIAVIVRMNAITAQELRSLPGGERKLLPLLNKLKLVR